MATMTREMIGRRYDNGAGQGHGMAYRGWFRFHDFSSRGVTTRRNGRVVPRQYLLFSSLEVSAFLIAQRLPGVVDVREQYALGPLEATEALAARLGVRHPGFAGEPVMMTTDLVITRIARDGSRHDEAICVKPSAELARTRVQEKLKIERLYWEERGAAWSVVTEREMPADLVHNLRWIDDLWHARPGLIAPELILPTVDAIRRSVRLLPGEPLCRVCLGADAALALEPGTALNVFRHAVARNLLTVPLDVRLDPARPLPQRAVAAVAV